MMRGGRSASVKSFSSRHATSDTIGG
jgi:hypothetical protein